MKSIIRETSRQDVHSTQLLLPPPVPHSLYQVIIALKLSCSGEYREIDSSRSHVRSATVNEPSQGELAIAKLFEVFLRFFIFLLFSRSLARSLDVIVTYRVN